MSQHDTQASHVEFAAPGGPEVMEWRDAALRAPGPDEILLRHLAVGVNYLDLLMRTGRAPSALPGRLGLEGVGVVEAAGAASGLQPGDRVCYAGGPAGAYADRRLLPAGRALRLPDGIDPVLAAAGFFKGLTAHYLIHRMRPLSPGDAALVHAAGGGVGQILARWLSHGGVRVIGTVGTPAKAQAASAAGCEEVLVLGRDDVAARVRALTDGRGVQVAYDSVGRDSFETSIDSLARFGLLVSYGWASGEPAVDLNRLRNAGSLFLSRPTIAHYTEDRADLEAGAEAVFAMMQAGVIAFAEIETVPLDDVAGAHRMIEERRARGPVVLRPGM